MYPRVRVNKISDLYWVYDKGFWFFNESTPRAPGTRAKEVDYSVSTGSYLCLEYAKSKVIPDEMRNNADEPLRPDRDAVEITTDLLMLDQEVRIADQISTNGSTNWANSASPATQWDDDASDPIGDVETAQETLVSVIARQGNKATMGQQVWTHLKQHPDLLDRIKYTERGVITVELLSGLFDIPNIRVGQAIKNTANEGASDSFSFVWGKNMVILWSPEGEGSLLQPSAGYYFEHTGMETLRFRREEEFADVVTVRHTVDEVVTASDSGYAIYKAVS